MSHRRLRKPSTPAIFAMLMLASAVMITLPRDFFGSTRNMTQLVALPGWAVTQAADRVAESAKSLGAQPVPAEKHAETVRMNKSLENENVALARQVMAQQDLIAGLQGLRNRPQFPSQARLIPARVVGRDAVPGRDSMMVFKGRSEVQKGDWVASRLAVQAGSNDGVQENFRVLARETLLGWVEHTAPYTSRVVLLSDRHANRAWRVHVAARRNGQEKHGFVRHIQNESHLAEFALEGIGDGKMSMEMEARYVTEGRIQVGDVVTTDGQDANLPLAMVIGDIVDLQPIPKKPLLYNVIVKHRCDPKDLGEVFIIDASR